MNLSNKIKISFFIIFLTTVFFSMKVFAVTGIITEVTVNVREEASTDSKKIMYVTQDDEVEVLEKDGEWYKIEYNNKTGYVFGKYIKVDDTQLSLNEIKDDEESSEEIISTDLIEDDEEESDNNVTQTVKIEKNTQVRILPNILSNSIYVCNDEIEATILEQLNDWIYISSNTITGWIRTSSIITNNTKENVAENNEENTTENIAENNEENTTEIEVKEEEEEEQPQEQTSSNKKVLYIKYDTVNLRKSASATSEILAKLKLNDEVTVIEKMNNVWTKVEVDGKTGYISTELLSDKKQEETNKDTNTKEDTTSRSSDTASREENAEEEKQEETTANVSTEEKSEKSSSSTTSKASATGEDIVAYAKQFVGYKYVYGAASPSKGFDCSGLTYYVYKHFGYNLSRASTSQAKNGVKVEKSDMQPGDIIIFKNQSLTKIGHVGIYIGNNKMIHASEPGVGVVITDLDAKGYNYSKRFVMARRIIN